MQPIPARGGFFRTVFSLCGSFRAYRAVRDLPVTGSFKYLLKLLTLLGLVLMVSLLPWMLTRCEEFAVWVDAHFPACAIRDGQVVTKVKQPYYAGDSQFLFILDTTGKVTGPDPKALQGLLFTADSFVVWMKLTNAPEAVVQNQHHSLRGFPDGTLNGEYFRQLLHSFLWLGLPFSLALLVLIGSLSCLLQAYLFSVAASMLERSVPAPLRFAQLLNIAIHAVTPAAIILSAYLAMRLDGLNLWLIYLIAYGIFLVGGTNACREPDGGATAEPEA